jgi:hypothetical protein
MADPEDTPPFPGLTALPAMSLLTKQELESGVMADDLYEMLNAAVESKTRPSFESLVETAINTADLDAALKPLMDFLGITDGGIAGQIFCGDPGDSWPSAEPYDRKLALVNWIGTEIMWMGDI